MAKSMKARLLLKKLKAADFLHVRTEGSHQVWFQESTKVTVIVPAHGMNEEIAVGTVNAILKQAGLK